MKRVWQRKDIGSGEKLTVETEVTVNDRKYQFVPVLIPFEAYQRLVNWASMGRTIDSVLTGLTSGSTDDQRNDAMEELMSLRDALNYCHVACRNHHTANDKVTAVKCEDGLTPDGPVCPKCGEKRAPSGVDGGTWVHFNG